MGPARRVADVPPLVHGSLDLAEARAAHLDGAKQSGNTAALHMMIQFPTDLPIRSEEDQRAMLGHAVRFANTYHGGNAVFAARLDRDEQGRHTVDVFAMPVYDFEYSDGRTARKASVSKFSKENAERRFGKSDPRSQGRALQAAWAEYLKEEMGLDWLEERTPKRSRKADQLSPEDFKRKKDLDRREAGLDARALDLDQREAGLRRKAKRVIEREAAVKKSEGRVIDAAKALVERSKSIEAEAQHISAIAAKVADPKSAALAAISAERLKKKRAELER